MTKPGSHLSGLCCLLCPHCPPQLYSVSQALSLLVSVCLLSRSQSSSPSLPPSLSPPLCFSPLKWPQPPPDSLLYSWPPSRHCFHFPLVGTRRGGQGAVERGRAEASYHGFPLHCFSTFSESVFGSLCCRLRSRALRPHQFLPVRACVCMCVHIHGHTWKHSHTCTHSHAQHTFTRTHSVSHSQAHTNMLIFTHTHAHEYLGTKQAYLNNGKYVK